MRIAFLYCDPIHAWPLLGAVPHLADHGVTLQPVRLAPKDPKAVKLAAKGPTLIHHELLAKGIQGAVVSLDRIDGAQLASRSYLASGSILGVLKSYVLDPPSLYNLFPSRVHEAMLSDTVPEPPEPLTDKQLASIRCTYGFGHYQRLTPTCRAKFSWRDKRATDLHFAGTVEYRPQKDAALTMTLHRKKAMAVIQAWPGTKVARSGRPLRAAAYVESMLDAKIAVSPWGLGEACHRDYEALLLGCLLVKPRTDHVVAWPHIYEAGVTYFPCAHDFSDLHDIAATLLTDWDAMTDRRIAARKLVLEARKPENIAAQIAPHLKDLFA